MLIERAKVLECIDAAYPSSAEDLKKMLRGDVERIPAAPPDAALEVERLRGEVADLTSDRDRVKRERDAYQEQRIEGEAAIKTVRRDLDQRREWLSDAAEALGNPKLAFDSVSRAIAELKARSDNFEHELEHAGEVIAEARKARDEARDETARANARADNERDEANAFLAERDEARSALAAEKARAATAGSNLRPEVKTLLSAVEVEYPRQADDRIGWRTRRALEDLFAAYRSPSPPMIDHEALTALRAALDAPAPAPAEVARGTLVAVADGLHVCGGKHSTSCLACLAAPAPAATPPAATREAPTASEIRAAFMAEGLDNFTTSGWGSARRAVARLWASRPAAATPSEDAVAVLMDLRQACAEAASDDVAQVDLAPFLARLTAHPPAAEPGLRAAAEAVVRKLSGARRSLAPPLLSDLDALSRALATEPPSREALGRAWATSEGSRWEALNEPTRTVFCDRGARFYALFGGQPEAAPARGAGGAAAKCGRLGWINGPPARCAKTVEREGTYCVGTCRYEPVATPPPPPAAVAQAPEAREAAEHDRELHTARDLAESWASAYGKSEAHGERLADAIRAFRNLDALGKLPRLRSTPEYGEMCAAWEAWDEREVAPTPPPEPARESKRGPRARLRAMRDNALTWAEHTNEGLDPIRHGRLARLAADLTVALARSRPARPRPQAVCESRREQTAQDDQSTTWSAYPCDAKPGRFAPTGGCGAKVGEACRVEATALLIGAVDRVLKEHQVYERATPHSLSCAVDDLGAVRRAL